MKTIFKIAGAVILLLFILLTNSCTKDKPVPPVLTTSLITDISFTTAISGGIITNEGGAPVVSRGVCWNTSANPSINNSLTIDGTGLGVYISNITNLTPNTTYYLRAYALNSSGTGYGKEISFTTSQVTKASLITAAITSVTQTSAITGGNITNENGGSVTERGVCWSTFTNPTTADSKTSDGNGSGVFTSSLTGLTGNTLYYVRAFASNTAGTEYGNEISFKTGPLLASIDTKTATSITQTSALSGGTVISDGGSTVTVRGVCWSTTAGPTIALNTKTTDGNGTGSYTSSMLGLTIGTTYFIRAYATNSVGTSYGSEKSFTTNSATIPVLTTMEAISIKSTSCMGGGNILSDGGATVTNKGVCWSTSVNPTIANNKTTDGNGTGTGIFISSISGLSSSTTYFMRAYAINSAGIGYGNELSFKTYAGSVIDIEGNVYNTVTIGTQEWITENLKTSKFNDNTLIPLIESKSDWSALLSPGYCWYNNSGATYKAIYGALYNWYAVNMGKLCPVGWHVPSDDDWKTLEIYLGMTQQEADAISWRGTDEAGKIKSTSGWNSSGNGSNSSGFTGLPGGHCDQYGNFDKVGDFGRWWSSTEGYTSNFGYFRTVFSTSNGIISRDSDSKLFGLSVRCIKN